MAWGTAALRTQFADLALAALAGDGGCDGCAPVQVAGATLGPGLVAAWRLDTANVTRLGAVRARRSRSSTNRLESADVRLNSAALGFKEQR
jgi:hypothetical protein